MKQIKNFLHKLFVGLILLFFSSLELFVLGAFIKLKIEDSYPGAFKDKNTFYDAYENRPRLYINNLGEYCREGGVDPNWVIPNTVKYFDGELYVLYNVPENAISENSEWNRHGFLGLGSLSRDLNDQVRFYEIGWVHYEDIQNESCGTSRIKDIRTYKRFL